MDGKGLLHQKLTRLKSHKKFTDQLSQFSAHQTHLFEHITQTVCLSKRLHCIHSENLQANKSQQLDDRLGLRLAQQRIKQILLCSLYFFAICMWSNIKPFGDFQQTKGS